MPPKASGRVHRYLVDPSAQLQDGQTLDKLQLFLPDGTAIDLSGSGGGGGYLGLWEPDTDYAAGSIVGMPHDNFETTGQVYTFGTPVDMPMGMSIPGTSRDNLIEGQQYGSTPTGDYVRIHEGPQSYDYVDGWAYFFFDLAAGGDVVISSTVVQQVPQLYNDMNELLYSGGLSIPASAEDLPPGRYFVPLQNGQGGDGTETVTLTLSNGAAEPDADLFWHSLG